MTSLRIHSELFQTRDSKTSLSASSSEHGFHHTGGSKNQPWMCIKSWGELFKKTVMPGPHPRDSDSIGQQWNLNQYYFLKALLF